MLLDKIHLCHCILYMFQQGKDVAKASRNLCEEFEDHAVSDKKLQKLVQEIQT